MFGERISRSDFARLYAERPPQDRSVEERAAIERFRASLVPAVYDPVEGHTAQIIYDDDEFSRTIYVVEVLIGKDDLYLDAIWLERDEERLFASRKIVFVRTACGQIFDFSPHWFAAAKHGLIDPGKRPTG